MRANHSHSSLPRYLTSFVGRDGEIAEISDLLMRDDLRLLTLIGPGGAGKTRLAVEVVNRLDEDAWEDIRFIPLVAVRDPALVLPSIAQALGLHQVTGRPVDQSIAHFLSDRHVLLVIDNFELVTDAAPDLGSILVACPGVTMLVTSRVALRIAGEHLFLVRPLETPDATNLPLDRLRKVESVRLFLERANMTGRGLTLSAENASSISRICQRLDGLPLALELAAARCGLMAPGALENILKQSFGILSDGPSDAPERHRSLHDAIAWSYDLLPEQEQTVFRRLAVFNGGFSLEAAEAVVDVPVDMLGAIASLIRQSLVVPMQANDSETRFTMLETLREFGLERLTAEGEAQGTRDRHATYFHQEAIDGEFAWCMYVDDGRRWLNQLVADQGNLRDALAWMLVRGDILRCLRMAAALATLWVVWGSLIEGYEWLDRLLQDPRATPGPERANGLATFSWVSRHLGKMVQSLEMAEACIAMGRAFDDHLAVTRCHVLAGAAAYNLDQHDIAIQRHKGAIDYVNGLDEPPWRQNFVVIASAQLGIVTLLQGHILEAERYFKVACDHDINRGFEPGTSFIYGNQVLNGLAHIARARNNPAEALQLHQRNLRLAVNNSNNNFCVHALCDIAGTLAALGQNLAAARLFGASEALHETYGYEFQPSMDIQRALGLPEPWAREEEPYGAAQGLHNALAGRSIARLTATELDEVWRTGRTLSLDEAVNEALAVTAEFQSTAPITSQHPLTSREIEVLRLIAEGHSNRAIAETLSLSERTVEHHVTHILAKLDLDSRTAAATFAVRQGMMDA